MKKRFTPEQRKAVVAEAAAPGKTVAAVTKKHGIGESTFYNWQKEFGGGGRKKRGRPPKSNGISTAGAKSLKSIIGKSGKGIAGSLAPVISELKGVQDRLNRELQQVTSAIRALEGR